MCRAAGRADIETTATRTARNKLADGLQQQAGGSAPWEGFFGDALRDAGMRDTMGLWGSF